MKTKLKKNVRLKKLVIDRKKWYRGKESGSLLLRSDGKMCCLGFLGKECGLEKSDIKGVDFPENVGWRTNMRFDFTKNKLWAKGVLKNDKEMGYIDTKWTGIAVKLNDDTSIDDVSRETKLKEHFEKIGYKVSFVK